MSNEKQTKLVIGAEVSQAEAALKKLTGTLGQMEQAAGRLKNPFQALGAHLLSPVAAATAGFAALGAAIKKTADAGEEMGKFAQQAGVSVEWISGMKYAAEQSETSIESLVTGIGLFSKGMAEGGEEGNKITNALDALGISAKNADGTLRPTEALFSQIAEKFSTMEDGAGKVALSMAFFGRSGKELIPLMNEGAAGIERFRQEAARLGIVFTEDMAKAADEFNDNLTRLRMQFNGIVNIVGNAVIPVFNELVSSAQAALQPLDELDKATGNIKQHDLREWGLNVQLTFIEVAAEIQRVAMLLDKVGGTITGYGLIPGKMREWNQMFKERYEEGEKRLQALADRYVSAENKLLQWQKMTPYERTLETTRKRVAKSAAPILGDDKESKGKSIADLAEEHRLSMMKQEEKEAQERLAARDKFYDNLLSATQNALQNDLQVWNEWAQQQYELLGKADYAYEEVQRRIIAVTEAAEAKKREIRQKAADEEREMYDRAIHGTQKRKPGEFDTSGLSVWDGFMLGIDDYLEKLDDSFTTGTKLADTAAERMRDSFSDVFFHTMKGETTKMEDLFQGVFDSILRAWSDMLGQMMAQWAAQTAKSIFGGGPGGSFGGVSLGNFSGFLSGGGLTGDFFNAGLLGSSGFADAGASLAALFHDGGYVAPRFHSGVNLRGLGRDEVPAILQTGEGVLSRRGMSALDMLNSGRAPSTPGGNGGGVNINIYAHDSDDVRRWVEKNADVIVGASINNIIRNGALRGAINSAT